MRSAFFSLLVGASALSSAAFAQGTTPAAPVAQSQTGPADLCGELLAYAEKTAAGPAKPGPQAGSAAAPAPRADGHATGTQGGGSVSGSSSSDTSAQSSAPPTAPVATGAAPEAASSPHATDGGGGGSAAASASGPKDSFRLSGGLTLQQVRDVARAADRQGCRDTTQKLRRAGNGLPAELIALAAYEPDPAKRK
jgi:hypothetical protein